VTLPPVSAELREADADPDPFTQFDRWLEDAIVARLAEPTAMVVATASADGVPSARLVLLKGVEDGAFRFYTDYASAKALDVEVNPRAALVFPWHGLQRQVRVTGTVARVAPEISDAYWATRPRGAQVGAWASAQSKVIDDRATLERAAAEIDARYGAGPIPRPPDWGGYAVAAQTFEFWQGRPDRLHDRLRYRRDARRRWTIERLAP
jgi:pyridoxamine 5'-phosphate oxidase